MSTRLSTGSTVVCPDPNHDPAVVTLLEEIEKAAQVVYKRLEGTGHAVSAVSDLGKALEARELWSGKKRSYRVEGDRSA